MISALVARLTGNAALLLVVALAAFSAGWVGGLRWEKVATLKAELDTAQVLQDVAEQATANALAETAEAERRADIAARIAASTALEARDREIEIRRLREQHRDITSLFRAEPVDPACDCSLSDATRRKLLDIKIERPAQPAPGSPPPAPAGRGGAPLPGSRGGP